MKAKQSVILLLICAVCMVLLFLLSYANYAAEKQADKIYGHAYKTLEPDISDEEPLKYITSDFYVLDGFSTNLPVVVLSVDGEFPQYKTFKNEEEISFDTEPWVSGSISVYNNPSGGEVLSGNPDVRSDILIKERGHSSISYDKNQYMLKLTDENGLEADLDILEMGADSEWILNGSMADKSMIRNYLCYRVASEIMSDAPDSRFCEVLFQNPDGSYTYQGVFLMMETVSRSVYRVDIDDHKKKNAYTSYIIRRDRYTAFDTMLDTYGRLNGYAEQWIGVKYPGKSRMTEANKLYIENDYSKIEQLLYSDSDAVFKQYASYIDVSSFVDYFIVNEFFGNYDAGEHSTYMYKATGGKLRIGPVWDFDQAINNSVIDETDAQTLAFQDKPLFDRLIRDTHFIDLLKSRYNQLRKASLSEKHINELIGETTAYLTSARQREWYRWAADYYDGSGENAGNYYLSDYEKDGVLISRFNDNYDQEIYNIKTYLNTHGRIMQQKLTEFYQLDTIDTSIGSYNILYLMIFLVIFAIPSIIISKRK